LPTPREEGEEDDITFNGTREKKNPRGRRGGVADADRGKTSFSLAGGEGRPLEKGRGKWRFECHLSQTGGKKKREKKA